MRFEFEYADIDLTLQNVHRDSIIALMFDRFIAQEMQQALRSTPAVVLLGPRQIGKTTLALSLARPDGVYLDLESPEDRSKLSNVEQYLRAQQDRLVVLDEVQRLPTLFDLCAG